MRDVVISVDLETTGLDPRYERIIEIGAVMFRGDDVLDEWHALVNPEMPVPAFITRLTGITDQNVADAPPISRVLPKLERFIAQAPLVGHNVRFDAGFLNGAGLRRHGPLIDTYTLASVMLPAAPRYNLTALTTSLGIAGADAHRALNDAYMTMALYNALFQQVRALPLDVLAEIVRLGKMQPWDAALPFEDALRERTRETFTAARGPLPAADEAGDGYAGDVEALPELYPSTRANPVDLDALVSLVEPGGALAAAFDEYEYREQQANMLRAVGQAFNEGQHVMIEAPTGVGKSLAYLIPAAVYAVRNDDRVVISTNTINLQEQLLTKDIPLLKGALGLPFRAAVLKGRSNYLCPRRLAGLRRRGPTSAEEMHMLAKVLVWQTLTDSGDRGDITLRGPVEAAIWRRLSAEDEGCTTERCMVQMGGTCPFYRARRRAQSAHLLIVNHALLLSDVAAEGRVLPEYRHVIVDEAHHLEDAVTNSMSFRTDPEDIQRQLAELGSPQRGLLGDLLIQTQGAIPAGYHDTLRDYAAVVAEAASSMGHHVDYFFSTLRQFLTTHTRIERNEYTQQVRILPPHRRQPMWTEVEIAWDNLSRFTEGIAVAMEKLAGGLAELESYDIEDYDDVLAATRAISRRMTALHLRLHEIANEPDGNSIYWAEFQPDGGRISLHVAPLDVGPLVQEHIWFRKETVVMTSATLRTDGTFDYIRGRLDAADVSELVVDSPFDYESNTLLYLVDDIPEPNEREAYQRSVERGLLDLARATEGRMMVLFTSYAQLRETVNAIGEALERSGIEIYDQSDGSSRSQLLDGFVESKKAVLMGTRSFWEGVDVPGADLSVLVIVRLPFSVPSDPLYAARQEQFSNPFMEYAVPETVLRFRQGFGRLMRRSTDRGVVVILDRRVLTKRYGEQFLRALPVCTVRQGRLADLPDTAVRWLDGQQGAAARL